MDYIELVCKPATGQHTAELLVARLADMGFESFTEGEGSLSAYIPAAEFSPEIENALSLPDMKDLLDSFSSRIIKDQNWNALWESAYDPVLIDDLCVVRAPFHEKPRGVEYDIVIEPKMSFGTAHHETTRLMMHYMLEQVLDGKSLLDMGSGTGVLAILGCMKGAGPVTAIDNDEWAYNNAIENVYNNKPGQIEVLLGDSSLIAGRQYDVILANINRNILLHDISEYRKCLSTEGLLIMSGFYEEDLPMITNEASSHGLRFISSRSDNRWTAACYISV